MANRHEMPMAVRVGAAVSAVILAAAALGCAPAPAPGSPGSGDATPSEPPASTSPTASVSAPPGAPMLLLAVPAGLALASAGRPLERVAIALPPGAWQPTAAVGARGTVLLVSAANHTPATALEGALAGARVAVRWTIALPPEFGPGVLAGCVAADGAATVIADRLVYLQEGRVAGLHDVPATAGRCQMAAGDVVAYLADVDHAVAFWRPGADTAVVTATRCDDFGLGGGLIACLAGGEADVVVGRTLVPVAGGSAFDARSARRLPGPARQVVLAPDGRWVAVVALAGGVVTLYRGLADGGFDALTTFTLRAGEALVGFVQP